MPLEDNLPAPPRRKTILPRYYIFALLLTSAIFAFMILGFEVSTPETVALGEASQQRQFGDIVLLPTGPGVAAPSWQKELEAWIDLRDPTIMSLPDDRRGFSEILRIGFERPVKSIPEAESTVPIGEPDPLQPLTIAPPATDPMLTLAGSRLREPYRLPEAPVPAPREAGIYLTDLDGRPFERLPPLPLSALADLPAPIEARRPTEIVTIPRGRHLRVTIARSSGNPALDRLAVTHLRQRFSAYPASQEITEEMRWWLDQPHTLLVHWRFAPSVVNTSDPANEATNDDRSWF